MSLVLVKLSMYSVVEFPEEETVEVVSSNWLSNENRACYWPNAIGNKFKKILTTHADPKSTPGIAWSIHNCRLMGSYEDVKTAQRKRDRAQFTSNLESAAEETPKSSRRPKNIAVRRTNLTKSKTSNLSSTDSSSDDGPSTSVKASLPFQSPIHAPDKESTSAVLQLVQDYQQNSVDHRPPPPPSQGCINSTPGVDLCSNNVILSVLHSLRTELNQEREKNERFQEKVINRLVNLEQDVKHLLKQTSGGEEFILRDVGIDLPATTLDQFKDLRIFLDNTENFESVVKRLAVFGGRHPRDITNRILDELVTNELACQLSLTGKGPCSKEGFRGTSIIRLLFESVRRTKGGSQTTNSEIEEYTKKYLKNVLDKCKSQKKRSTCATPDVQVAPPVDSEQQQ